MLDQDPDKPPSDSGSPGAGKPDDNVEDAVFVEAPASTATTEIASTGGAVGKFRAGLAAKPKSNKPPLWRRILVGTLVWGTAVVVALVVVSALSVLLFKWVNPPPTINMAQRAMSGVEVRRTWVSLDQISPNLVRAVMANEDQRFCSHKGFDVEEIQKAVRAAERGRDLRGASTISQQTAKNVFLFNSGGFIRKGAEAWFTLLLETMWSKRRIMEVYLNVAEWGDGLYGAEAAAQARFGVSAKNLSPRQAALLAAVVPSPNKWRIDGSYAPGRATSIEAVMGVIRRDGLDACVLGAP